MIKNKTYNVTRWFCSVMWAVAVMLILPISVYAAQQAEGAIEAAPIAQPVLDTTDVALKSIEIKPTQKGTVYDYLVGVENELVAMEKEQLIHRGIEGDLYTLEDCLEVAIDRHLPIEIARDKISLYKRKLIKAIRELLPGLNLSYDHNKGFKLIKADTIAFDHTNQQFRSEKWRVALSQPIFRGGSLWNKVNEERANLRSAKAEYDKVFLDLNLEVARAYFTFAKSKTLLSYKEELLTKAQSSLGISEEKMNAALISEIEHLNVQSQESQIQHDLEATREDIALGLLDMQKVLHFNVSEPIDVNTLEGEYTEAVKKEMEAKEGKASKNEEEQEEELNRLLALAYENRPEFIIQKSKVDAATYRQKVAAGGWFPQLNVQVERGQKSEAYIEDDNNPSWDEEQRIAMDARWNMYGNTVRYMYDKNRQGTGVEATERAAGIGTDGYYDRRNIMSVALFDGLDQFVQTKEAEISRKEALLELELSEKDIVSEVKESFYNFNRALIQLKSVFKRLAYRKKLVDLAKHRSEINEIQISEFIQAEIDLINERDNLYKAMVDFFIAKVSLNKAIGKKDYSPIIMVSSKV